MVNVLRGDGKVYGDYQQSFAPADLTELEEFLMRADAVVPMRDTLSDHSPRLVAMRHDIDHDPEHALRFAQWEHERGFRSTYFMLHTAWYWNDHALLHECTRDIAALGHEVGLHIDGIGQALTEGYREEDERRDRAAELIRVALSELRDAGFDVVGACQHGSPACSRYDIANQDVFVKHPLEEFSLLYEAYFEHRKPHAQYYSDNHGDWHKGGDHIDVTTPPRLWVHPGNTITQAHVLVHPCHWQLP